MKRIISLIISASLFLQVIIPTASLVTYAQTGDSPYGLKWEIDHQVGEDLQVGRKKVGDHSTGALVSWGTEKAGRTSAYVLEYMVQGETGPEKVRFTFDPKLTGNQAEAKLEVVKKNEHGIEEAIKKTYNEFDFSQTQADGNWIEYKDVKEVALDISGSRFPGARVLVGKMDIRFRWENNKVYFQTTQIEHGNLTPFSLKYNGTPDRIETVSVLTGIEAFAASPVHLEIDEEGQITSKEVIEIRGDAPNPDDREEPGSKPGIKINFNRPKQWDNGDLKTLTTGAAIDIAATLTLNDLTGTANAQLTFNLGDHAVIYGAKQETEKQLIYDASTGTYSLYLAKDDKAHPSDTQGHKNIIKLDKLAPSMIMDKIELDLIRTGGTDPQALGRFTPRSDKAGQGDHTYLGYTIGRSSMEEAFIEIQPYNGAKNTDHTYIIESAPNVQEGQANWQPLIEQRYVTTGGKTEKPFRIAVPFSSNSGNQYYRVRVKRHEVIMWSQILRYQPDKDSTVPPPTPMIQSVDNIYTVPPKNLEDQPETIGFDLTWSAPKNTSNDAFLTKLLEEGNIYYELFLHDDLEFTEGDGKLIKVFKVGLKEGEITVDPYGGTAGKTLDKFRYSPSKDTFTMENIVIKKPDVRGWEQIENLPENYHKGTQYPEINSSHVNNDLTGKEVPGVYYVTMRALYESEGSFTPMGLSNTSNPKSITISPLHEVVPVPTRIESKPLPDENDADVIRQSFSWENIDLYRYIKQMLEPLGLTIGGEVEGKGVYEVYLYQKKNMEESKIEKTSPAAINLDLTKHYELEDEDLEKLRKGEVIRLDYKGSSSGGMNNILLERLDANQVYYMKVRVKLDIINKEGKREEPRYSVLSKEHSFTSYIKPSEPGPGERVPPVPEELELIDQPNNTTAKIGWKAPKYTKQEDEVLYYEVLRVDSRLLAKEEDSRLFSIKDLMGKDAKGELHGWRTKGPLVDQYQKTGNKWTQATPQQPSNKLQLEDDSLSPNEIYHYYVRTVLIVDGEEVYSSWVGIPVTTDPIQKPIMLKVEHKDDYFHDPKREIVISFLAPIPKGSKVPGDYDFDIAVQGELDDSYRLDYSTTRVTSKEDAANIPTGYDHFVYKINKVKPGKRYDIKVRTIDKVLDMVNGQYPKSLYSGRVSTRTHFDQDEQDKDDKFEQYLKYFEDKVESLRRKPYWELDEGANRFSAKYRSNYIIPQINSSKTVQLVAEEGVRDFTYYMPASAITSSNISQTSFEIKQGDITYSIRPSTITTDLQEVKNAVLDINEKYIRDYYITFHFSQRARSSSYQHLTPEITVDIGLVRLREEDLILEDDIIVALNQEIADETVRYIDDLERALKRGKLLDEDLDAIVNNSIGHIEIRHQKAVRNIVVRNTQKNISINKWNKSMLLMAIIEGRVSGQGYKLEWTDRPITTFNVKGGYGIEVNESGTYVFKGQKVNIPVIPGIGDTGDLVIKYGLTDFFGIQGIINPSASATKENVLGAMARVLGAPRGANYVQYLKGNGIKGITNIGMQQPMKTGEGIYFLMQAYEKIHKKPITSVHIKNRGAVSNLRQFNQIHRPYVLVAVDSKLVSQGSGINPNEAMEVKYVLQLLDNIMKVTR